MTTIPPINAGPIARTARTLTDAPSSMTATSSSVFALNAMPTWICGPGVHAVRTATPMRIARTSASR